MAEQDFAIGEKGVLELLAEEAFSRALALAATKYVEAIQRGDYYIAKLILPEICGIAQRIVDREAEAQLEDRISLAQRLVKLAVQKAANHSEHVSSEDVVRRVGEALEQAFPRKGRRKDMDSLSKLSRQAR